MRYPVGVTFLTTEAQRQALEDAAREDERSVSSVIRRAIAQHVTFETRSRTASRGQLRDR
jgi:hypothetical protein